MKNNIVEFCRRGLTACGFGPVILAVVYMILHHNSVIETLTVNQVCIGIFSLSALAFIAGGMNIIYQIEHLPLMPAIFIHGLVLYISYLITYLINDWLEAGTITVLFFTVIFIAGYLVVWVVIYLITRHNTIKLNRILNEKNKF